MKRFTGILCVVIAGFCFPASSSSATKTFGRISEFTQTRAGDFDDAVKEADIVVVDFYWASCGPCKQLSPHIEALAKELPDVKFIKVDTTKNPDVAKKYGIRSVPQLFFFKNGVHRDTIKGCPPKDPKGVVKKKIDSLR